MFRLYYMYSHVKNYKKIEVRIDLKIQGRNSLKDERM